MAPQQFFETKISHVLRLLKENLAPSVNICKYPVGLSFRVCLLDPLGDPVDEMVLECPLDDLMKKVRRQKFMYICSRKSGGKWL